MKNVLILLTLIVLSLGLKAQGTYVPINSSYWFKETGSDAGGNIRISDSLSIGWSGTTFGTKIDTTGKISKYGGSTISDNDILIGSGGKFVIGTLPSLTLSGLNPYEVLLADGSGDLFQTPNFQWSDEFGSDFLSITGVNPQISISEGAYGGTFSSQAAYLTDGTGVASELIPGSLRFYDDDGGSITLSKYDGNTGTGYNYIFPATNGINGQSLRLNASLENEWFTPGSVTSFTFTDGSGFDGTVTNSTTTPTLSLTTTVGDNMVMYSNSGGISGSSLFTYDDATNNERLDATIFDFIIRGTSTYGALLYADDGGSVQMGDVSGSANGTAISLDDSGEIIVLDADNGVVLAQFAAFDAITYVDNATDVITPVTLTSNDFDFSSGTLSFDYTNSQKANGSQPGLLSAADWGTFNSKLSSEVDGSTSNELQTIASTDDATSHTVTLSNSGGSFQLVEGTNISLTTTGTSSDAIITISSSGATFQQTYGISIMNY